MKDWVSFADFWSCQEYIAEEEGLPSTYPTSMEGLDTTLEAPDIWKSLGTVVTTGTTNDYTTF